MVTTKIELPGLDCGLCGYRTCEEFRGQLASSPESIRRCIHLSESSVRPETTGKTEGPHLAFAAKATEKGDSPHLPAEKGTVPLSLSPQTCQTTCGGCTTALPMARSRAKAQQPWRDNLGREFDFYLEHFPEDPGPREIILPHNPAITREMDVQVGDILIGRPLGMSCGCPITHCGVATQVDMRTGVIVWCVTGPLAPRAKGFKDLGYYIAEGYEGLVRETRAELKVGLRYFFQPKMCMLQWRHSGLLNYLNRTGDQYQVRLEGLWIG
ncbi:MAG: (Fe-S)-binding protein [Thermoguttaceae bacterium]